MIIEIKRNPDEYRATIGSMFIDGVEIAKTLELPWVDENGDKISDKEKSCINSGVYNCKRINSPHFGEVFEICNVPNRTHVLIHKGNFLKDTKGCIVVGLIRGEKDNSPCVYQSTEAFNRFMKHLEGLNEFDLRIN